MKRPHEDFDSPEYFQDEYKGLLILGAIGFIVMAGIILFLAIGG